MSKKRKIVRKRLPPEELDDATILSRFIAQQEFVAEDAPPERTLGRPTSYQPRYAKIAEILCGQGATDSVLADAFGVSIMQTQRWQSMYPEFGAAVRKGKSEVYDPRIERALAQRALGYSIDCEEVKVTKDGDLIRYQVRKHFPPDVTAMIFWLKNRQPARWRDVWKIDHSGKVDTSNMTSEQVLAEIKGEMEKLGLLPQQVAQSLGVVPFPEPKSTPKSNGTKH